MTWHDQAACTNQPLFLFDSRDLRDQLRALRTFCATCPVRATCETEAIKHGDNRHTVRGNRMVAATRDGVANPWIPPTGGVCGTRGGPAMHRRTETTLCTLCRLVANARQSDRYLNRKKRNRKEMK